MVFSVATSMTGDRTCVTDHIRFYAFVFAVSADHGHAVPVLQLVHIGRQLCRVVRLCVQLAGGVLQTAGRPPCRFSHLSSRSVGFTKGYGLTRQQKVFLCFGSFTLAVGKSPCFFSPLSPRSIGYTKSHCHVQQKVFCGCLDVSFLLLEIHHVFLSFVCQICGFFLLLIFVQL